MKVMQTSLLKFFVLCALNLLCFAQNHDFSFASNPSLAFNDLHVVSTDSSYVSGEYTMNNPTDIVFPKLWVSSELYVDNSDATSALINIAYHPVEFKAYETKTFQFKHPLPNHIPRGNYSMVFRVLNRVNTELGIYALSSLELSSRNLSPIHLAGNEIAFLVPNASKTMFIQDGASPLPLTGPSFEIGEKPVLKASYKHNSSQSVTTRAKFEIYNRSVFLDEKPIFTEITSDIFTFEPNVEKEVTFLLPPMEKPESYYAVITLVDDKQKPISGMIEARYVIKGENAKIIDATTHFRDEKLMVVQHVAGPADGSRINHATLHLSVSDEMGEVVKKSQKLFQIDAIAKSVVFEFPIKGSTKLVRIHAEIEVNGNVLDQTATVYPMQDLVFASQKLPPPANPALGIIDVKDTPYAEAVNHLITLGVVTGYEDNSFRPTKNITRAEFITMVYKFANPNQPLPVSNSADIFPDVSRKHWAYEIIKAGVASGLLKGYPDGTFQPDRNVSYAEAITVLIQLLGNENENKQLVNWPDDFLTAATKKGLTQDISFGAKSAANRGDIAKLIYNAYFIKLSME